MEHSLHERLIAELENDEARPSPKRTPTAGFERMPDTAAGAARRVCIHIMDTSVRALSAEPETEPAVFRARLAVARGG